MIVTAYRVNPTSLWDWGLNTSFSLTFWSIHSVLGRTFNRMIIWVSVKIFKLIVFLPFSQFYYFMWMNAFPACKSVYHMCVWCPWRAEESINLFYVSCHMGICPGSPGSGVSILSHWAISLLLQLYFFTYKCRIKWWSPEVKKTNGNFMYEKVWDKDKAICEFYSFNKYWDNCVLCLLEACNTLGNIKKR